MNRLRRGFSSYQIPAWAAPFLLLLISGLAYGLLFNRLGYFWDEWPIQWIANRLGAEGLALYFETNRPFWGQIYRLTTAVLGGDLPWVWQLFGLLFHWLTACGLWMTVRLTWSSRRGETVALWTGILFLVYPGFRQSPIAFMYGHFFIAYAAFFWSLAFNLLALRKGGIRSGWGAAAILLSLVNLLSLEYFFTLELLRPVLLWLAVSDFDLPPQKRALRALKAWLPYLSAFLAVILWRTLIFAYQTHNYQPSLLSRLAADPVAGLSDLASTVLKDLVVVTLSAWDDIFRLPALSELGARGFSLWAVGVLTGLAALLLFTLNQRTSEAREKKPLFQMALLALGALILGGMPFWVTDLPVGLGFPNDRFTLPFILGVSLLIASLAMLLPGKLSGPLALSALASLAIGFQVQNCLAYQRDWNTQRSLFWQMSWRIPALDPGTAMVTSQMPLRYFSDNSLAAPLNWIYDSDRNAKAGGIMDYMFYDAAVRSTHALKLEKGQPILQGYLAANFKGSSDRLVVFAYQPPACFRVLDADLDPLNPDLPAITKEAAAFSNLTPIQVAAEQISPPASIFGAEPFHGWCYYYEKADLARQAGDWEKAEELAGQAFASGDYPNDPAERLLFIEVYAHRGNWQRAIELTEETVRISGLTKPSLARLWQRIESQTPDSPERSKALARIKDISGME